MSATAAATVGQAKLGEGKNVDPNEENDYRLPTALKPTHYELTILTDLERRTFEGVVRISVDVLEDTKTVVLNSVGLEFRSVSVRTVHHLSTTETSSFSTPQVQVEANNENDLTGHTTTQMQMQTKTRYIHSPTLERTTLFPPSPLEKGTKAEVRIGYGGRLGGELAGYYLSSYEREREGESREKVKEWYALTQFQPTSARRAFPSFDEPAFKATFRIRMVSRVGTVNVSGMGVSDERVVRWPLSAASSHPQTADDESTSHQKPQDGDEEEDLRDVLASYSVEGLAKEVVFEEEEGSGIAKAKWNLTTFAPTPPMSTYIVAFANGPFEFREAVVRMPLSGRDVPLRVYSTPDIKPLTQFALDVKKRVLPIYEEMFGIEYPLDKLDSLVASDFDLGAMENWGLITGRQTIFSYSPLTDSIAAKKRVATIVSHEVSHMWFGNITTMKWWDCLFLNEGFATLVGEVLVADRVFPEWKLKPAFINDALNSALRLDAKLSSHPIQVECPDANHITQIFDDLSYAKAASVLLMLLTYVGTTAFTRGVSIYLKKHLYGNSVPEDLWEGISEAGGGDNENEGADVGGMMKNWITCVGIPVVTVTEDEDGIVVRQDRFLENGVVKEEDNRTIWHIPLRIVSEKDGQRTIDNTLLTERSMRVKIDTNKTFKLNADNTGVYRVLYTPTRLSSIAHSAILPHSLFTLEDRIGLIHDVMALARAGLARVGVALGVVWMWKGEDEYLVWRAIANSLDALKSTWWEYDGIVGGLDKFRRTLFVPLVNKLGYDDLHNNAGGGEGESPDTIALRALAVEVAADAGDEVVVKELLRRFKAFQENGDDKFVPPGLQRTIFTTAVKHLGQSAYNTVLQIYRNPKSPSTIVSAIYAVTAAHDPTLISSTLSLIPFAKDQDVFYFFMGFYNNFVTRKRLTAYFEENYAELIGRLENGFTLADVILYSIKFYTKKADLEAVEAFFKDKNTSKYSQALAQALESIRNNGVYVERSTKDLEEWLNEHVSDS